MSIIKLPKKTNKPIKKITINGALVNDVMADIEISKYFNKDIFDFPENLFLREYLIPFCLKPIKEINPLKYKFFSSNFLRKLTTFLSNILKSPAYCGISISEYFLINK